MPTSTRWRINVSEPGPLDLSEGWVGIAQVAMASVAGGPDLCVGGTPSASSEWGVNYVAAKAFDHDTTSYWSSGATDVALPMPQWIEYAFAAPVAIVEYRLQAEDGVPPSYMPAAWALEYWNGATWVAVDQQVNQVEWTQSEIRTFVVTPRRLDTGGVRLISTVVRVSRRTLTIP